MSDDAAGAAGTSRLARWSRRKRQATEARHGDTASTAGLPPATDPPPPAAGEAPAAPDLPDIDALGADGDYTPFLAADVPDELHRRALRALWRSDPLFAHRDGLTDYDEDYTKIGIVAQTVATAYRAGSGYADAAPDAGLQDEAAGEFGSETGDPAVPAPGNSGTADIAEEADTDEGAIRTDSVNHSG